MTIVLAVIMAVLAALLSLHGPVRTAATTQTACCDFTPCDIAQRATALELNGRAGGDALHVPAETSAPLSIVRGPPQRHDHAPPSTRAPSTRAAIRNGHALRLRARSCALYALPPHRAVRAGVATRAIVGGSRLARATMPFCDAVTASPAALTPKSVAAGRVLEQPVATPEVGPKPRGAAPAVRAVWLVLGILVVFALGVGAARLLP